MPIARPVEAGPIPDGKGQTRQFLGEARCRKPRSGRSRPERHLVPSFMSAGMVVGGMNQFGTRLLGFIEEPVFITARGASAERYVRSLVPFLLDSSYLCGDATNRKIQ